MIFDTHVHYPFDNIPEEYRKKFEEYLIACALYTFFGIEIKEEKDEEQD